MIKDKLQSVLGALLSSSRIPKIYAPVIKQLIENFMKDISESEVRTYIIQLRDEFIPWLLQDETDIEIRKG